MSSTSSNAGIGFGGMLAILFIGLKLTGHITWSWLWVLSPIWISAVVSITVVGVIILIERRAEYNNRMRRRHQYLLSIAHECIQLLAGSTTVMSRPRRRSTHIGSPFESGASRQENQTAWEFKSDDA